MKEKLSSLCKIEDKSDKYNSHFKGGIILYALPQLNFLRSSVFYFAGLSVRLYDNVVLKIINTQYRREFRNTIFVILIEGKKYFGLIRSIFSLDFASACLFMCFQNIQ